MSVFIKGLVQLILVIAFVIAAIWISNSLQIDKSDQKTITADRVISVETAVIDPQDYRLKFSATGSITARAEIDVIPEVSGRVVAVDDAFYPGGVFQAGQQLFEIDRRDYVYAVQRQEAEVARAKTALDLERAEAEAAIAEWDTMRGDEAVPDLVARRPQMAEAEANLKAAQADLATARLNLKRTRFGFPFNGRVLSATLGEGRYVTAGQSLGQVFDLDHLEVEAGLEPRYLQWLYDGNPDNVRMQVQTPGGAVMLPGYLKRGAADVNNTTRFATVSFGIREGAAIEKLLPGQFVTLHITGPDFYQVGLLPAQALQKDGKIWIVQADNTLTALAVDILYQGEETMAVKNWPGSLEVVTSRLSGAIEGQQVTILNEDTETE